MSGAFGCCRLWMLCRRQAGSGQRWITPPAFPAFLDSAPQPPNSLLLVHLVPAAAAKRAKRGDIIDLALAELEAFQRREDDAAAEAARREEAAAAEAAAAGRPPLAGDHRWHGYYEQQQQEDEDDW